MSEESQDTETILMQESNSSDVFPSNAAAGGIGISSAQEGDQGGSTANHGSSTHDKQKKWIHQIVRGWEESNNNQIASPPRPPSPSVPPPAWDGSSVTFCCINASTPTSDASTPTATAVLCRHCRCPSQSAASDGNFWYERMVSYQKDAAVKVSLWESASITAQLDQKDTLSNCDQILLCISMLDILSQVPSNGNVDDAGRLWSALAEILCKWQEELKDIAKPITVVLLGIVKSSDGPTWDNYSSWFSSSSLLETMTSLNMERNMHWYTPILLVDEDSISRAPTETPSLNKKRKLSTLWTQNHSVDFCFQSLIERSLLLQKDKYAVIDEADTADPVANEVNNPQEDDSNESPHPEAKKQRKESTDTVSPNSVVIDLTATVSADADEDSPKVFSGKSSPVKRSAGKAYITRNRR
jgi:hypothetical protein